MSAYSEASKAVFEVFDDTTPLVEGISIDEAFLDVRGMGRIAGRRWTSRVRLRREVLERVGLPITVGVARTKFLAKVASGVAKPDGLLVVPPGGELAFLHPLPVERLWGVGPVTADKLRERGHHDRRPGRRGWPRRRSSRCSGGRRAATCTPWPTTATRGRCRSAAAAARWARSARSAAGAESPEALDAFVVGLVDRARPPAARTRSGCAARSCCGCASTTSRARPARTRCPRPPQRPSRSSPPCAALLADGHADDRSAAASRSSASRSATSRTPARSSSCSPSTVARALDATLDSVRDRFGTAAITRAVLLGRDQGLAVPLLPD